MSYNCVVLHELRSRATALKQETHAVYLATLDARTPWYAKAFILLVVAYALSPIDLIPDFVPILGYLDDLIIIPAGIALTIKMIPATVMVEARARARTEPIGPGLRVAGTIIIVLIWIVVIVGILLLIRRWPTR